MDKNVIQKVVLGGVIVNDNKILIVQRDKNEKIYPGLWELPSGKKEDLETAQDALIREIKEEVGLNIIPIMPFNVFNYQIEKTDIIKDSTQINYLVQLVDNNIVVKLSEEHQDYKWISETDIDLYEISDSTKNVIKEAFKTNKLITNN